MRNKMNRDQSGVEEESYHQPINQPLKADFPEMKDAQIAVIGQKLFILVQMIRLSVLGKSKAVCPKVTASSNESGEMFST